MFEEILLEGTNPKNLPLLVLAECQLAQFILAHIIHYFTISSLLMIIK